MAIGKYKAGSLKSTFKQLGTKQTLDFDMSGTEAVIADYIDTVIQRLQKSLQDKGNTASGVLEASFNPLPIVFQSGKYIIELKYEGYGDDVDEGRKAEGFSKEARKKLVPKIYTWIQAKESLHSIATTKKEQISLAYAITTNILKKGTKASHWKEDVIGQDASKLQAEMTQTISAIIGKDLQIHITNQAQKALDGNHNNRKS